MQDLFQSLFYWITYSYFATICGLAKKQGHGFNPYFIGLPILICKIPEVSLMNGLFQSLFYWITYSYYRRIKMNVMKNGGFNPYFIGLPILIRIC